METENYRVMVDPDLQENDSEARTEQITLGLLPALFSKILRRMENPHPTLEDFLEHLAQDQGVYAEDFIPIFLATMEDREEIQTFLYYLPVPFMERVLQQGPYLDSNKNPVLTGVQLLFATEMSRRARKCSYTIDPPNEQGLVFVAVTPVGTAQQPFSFCLTETVPKAIPPGLSGEVKKLESTLLRSWCVFNSKEKKTLTIEYLRKASDCGLAPHTKILKYALDQWENPGVGV